MLLRKPEASVIQVDIAQVVGRMSVKEVCKIFAVEFKVPNLV
ncbi:MAG: hypothetical protein ABJI33_01710 [Balneola sp.]